MARYELINKLGEGGMGVVYEAYDRIRGVRLALKQLRNVNLRSIHRFKREFRALSNLSHPNIINLYELVADGDEWFLTMELVRGDDAITYVRAGRQIEPAPRPLGSRSTEPRTDMDTMPTMVSLSYAPVAAGDDGSAPPSMPQAASIAVDEIVDLDRLRSVLRQLADALHTLHQANLVHRDLKPSNVLVTPGGRLVLLDFGVVADLLEVDRDASALQVGTPQYMAPEQARGQYLTAATDWYAFGVLIYVALTGRLPYEGSSHQIMLAKQQRLPRPPSSLVTGIPSDLEELCMDLLASQPEARPGGRAVLARLGVTTTLARGSGPFPVLDASTRLFVGRDAELDALRREYAQVAAGACRCVMVQGRSGMGKTSLVDRFLWEVGGSARRPLLLSGRCHERESTIYKAFDGIINDLAHHLRELPPTVRRALLPRDAALIARLFPLLLPVLDIDEQDPGTIGPMPQRTHAIAALRSLLVALACEQPVILRTEDLQWADSDSVELLTGLMRAPAPPGVLLIATLRAEDEPHGISPVAGGVAMLRAWGLSTTIELGPLSEDEQRELLSRMATLPQFRGARARLADGPWTTTGGHPMLLVELARAMFERDDPGATAGIRLEDCLWERVSRLPGPGRALIEYIALAGTPLPLRVLAAAAEMSGSDAEQAMRMLRVTNLARNTRSNGEPWLVAYHDMVREAVVERMDEAMRLARHRRIAVALETWDQAPPTTLADLWLAAAEPVRAAFYRYRAARVAAEILALDRAADMYRSILELLPRSSGDREIDLLRCRACLGLAESMRVIACTDDALALLDSAQRLAESHGLVEELSDIHTMRGNLLFPLSDIPACLAEHQKALEYARSSASPEREARALSGLGDAHYAAGRMNSAYEHFHACITLCHLWGLHGIEAANLGMRGMTRYYQNELGTALADSLAGAVAAARCGNKRAEMVARLGCASWIFYEMGLLAAARGQLERALIIAEHIGARRFKPNSLTFLAKITALEGRHREAVELAREAVVLCNETGTSFVGAMALSGLAVVTRDPRVRQSALALGETLLRHGAASHNHLYFYRDAMDVALALGDAGELERYAQALEDYTRAEPLPWSRFFIERGRALAAYLRGQGDPRALSRLLGEAERTGLNLAARALRQALGIDFQRYDTWA